MGGEVVVVEEIKNYCLSKHMACETYPFGDIPICYKLNNKIFAQVYPLEHDYKITLKCTREMGEFYRIVYPEEVATSTAAILEYYLFE